MSIQLTHDSITTAAQVLTDGGVALVPTDTVYGLAASPHHPHAVRRIFELKARPEQKNLPIMVADPHEISALGLEVNAAAQRLLNSPFVPGPVTLALGFIDGAERPAWLAGRVEVALRIPDNDLLRALLRATGPLLVTSANRSGAATGESYEAIAGELTGVPDVVLDGGRLSCTPSTLVNCNLPVPVVERVGQVSEAEINEVLRGA